MDRVALFCKNYGLDMLIQVLLKWQKPKRGWREDVRGGCGKEKFQGMSEGDVRYVRVMWRSVRHTHV